MAKYTVLEDDGKVTQWSPPDILTKLPKIITQFKTFKRELVEKVSKSVRTYVYLVSTFQASTKSCMVGNSAFPVDAQQVYKSTFNTLLKEYYSINANIDRNQGILEHALTKIDFLI